MKKTNSNIDDLFAAARGEEPVISEPGARDLLRTSRHMQAAPFILTTKGILMTSFGLCAAAILGYIALSSSPNVKTITQSPASHIITASTQLPSDEVKNLLTSRVEEPKKADKIVKKLIIVKRTDDEIPTPPIPPLPPLVTTP